MTQQYHFASMAAWISSTDISHHDLLPHIPLISLSAINSSAHHGIAPQSLNSSSQPLLLPGDPCSCPVCWLWNWLPDSDSIWAATDQLFNLSLKCFSSDSDNCGDRTPASAPPLAKGRSSPTNTPVFLPISFVLPSFAWFYILLSTGQALLSTLSWYSACTSVSEGVFLRYPWIKMYSTTTNSSCHLVPPGQDLRESLGLQGDLTSQF